ncbi:MAG: hypothetical protein CL843_05380 [Crocinitomicaceae bacterium]|nr:hypothetical protein [Crocinitomicaceae bacterium]|tara:strand:- start:16863 stop:17804 length:942 start_codon:yes stop_codon:yes gene_type:complete
MAYLILIAGLVLLVFSGEVLVKGAVRLAYKFHISTLVVGMTVISFGTSAPELLVSIQATLSGHPDIAIGNVIGSNIANIALVLGITALIFPIPVERNSIRIDWPMMMIASLLLYFFVFDLKMVWWEGIILFCILLVFVYFLIYSSRKKNRKERENQEEEKDERSSSPIYRDLLYVAIGAIGLMFGADWLVDGAVDIAKSFGVSDLVISVTVVAFGTSAPELVTSVVAAFRKQTDISVGNLIGSNIFNIMAIMGITPWFRNIEINEVVLSNDILWMIAISAIVLPMMLINRKVTRLEGGILLTVYLAYIYFLLR